MFRSTGAPGRTGEGRIEFRYGEKLFYIGPAAGVLVNGKGGVYGYAASIATSLSTASS